jgi:hypothetical protein
MLLTLIAQTLLSSFYPSSIGCLFASTVALMLTLILGCLVPSMVVSMLTLRTLVVSFIHCFDRSNTVFLPPFVAWVPGCWVALTLASMLASTLALMRDSSLDLTSAPLALMLLIAHLLRSLLVLILVGRLNLWILGSLKMIPWMLLCSTMWTTFDAGLLAA